MLALPPGALMFNWPVMALPKLLLSLVPAAAFVVPGVTAPGAAATVEAEVNPPLPTEPLVELFQVGDEVTGPLGGARVDEQLARDMIERANHRDLFGLSRSRHAQVGAALGPGARQIRMRQGLAFVAIKQNDVAGLGLGLAQLEAQPHAVDLAGHLAAFQRVPGPPPAEVFSQI